MADDLHSLVNQIRTEVRTALVASGMTQAAVARQIGCSQKHVSAMVGGRSTLSIDWADKILQTCGRRLLVLSMSQATAETITNQGGPRG
ncbi:MAG: helix-turn-helix domain-containing protein [Actinoallomurus sp.]